MVESRSEEDLDSAKDLNRELKKKFWMNNRSIGSITTMGKETVQKLMVFRSRMPSQSRCGTATSRSRADYSG